MFIKFKQNKFIVLNLVVTDLVGTQEKRCLFATDLPSKTTLFRQIEMQLSLKRVSGVVACFGTIRQIHFYHCIFPYITPDRISNTLGTYILI